LSRVERRRLEPALGPGRPVDRMAEPCSSRPGVRGTEGSNRNRFRSESLEIRAAPRPVQTPPSPLGPQRARGTDGPSPTARPCLPRVHAQFSYSNPHLPIARPVQSPTPPRRPPPPPVSSWSHIAAAAAAAAVQPETRSGPLGARGAPARARAPAPPRVAPRCLPGCLFRTMAGPQLECLVSLRSSVRLLLSHWHRPRSLSPPSPVSPGPFVSPSATPRTGPRQHLEVRDDFPALDGTPSESQKI
jgi:hypothetical protein